MCAKNYPTTKKNKKITSSTLDRKKPVAVLSAQDVRSSSIFGHGRRGSTATALALPCARAIATWARLETGAGRQKSHQTVPWQEV